MHTTRPEIIVRRSSRLKTSAGIVSTCVALLIHANKCQSVFGQMRFLIRQTPRRIVLQLTYHTTEAEIIGRIVPDKTETHVESIPANVFIRELLRPIDAGFVVCP